MTLIVMEIQSNNNTAATLINSYTNRNDAESKYHQVLSAAAVSQVPIHSAVLITDRGKLVKSETYEHPIEPSEE